MAFTWQKRCQFFKMLFLLGFDRLRLHFEA